MVTRDDLIAYLLHRMPEEARASLAEQWLADSALHEQLRMAEAELLDAYARGEAAPEDRQAIDTWLLTSASQRDKLAFAEALTIALPGTPAPAAPRLVAGSAWRWLAAAAAAIVLLTGGVWWLARQNIALRQQIAARPGTAAPTPSAPPTQSTLARAEAIAVIPLRATDLRGGGTDTPRVVLPAGVSIVRFDLDLDVDDRSAAYTVTLSSHGRLVWREEPVRRASNVAAPVVPFWVPAGLLQPGDYEIGVSAGGRELAFFSLHIPPA
jgi:hypothetical protein